MTLVFLDLFWVRDTAWLMENYTGKRFWVNFLFTAFVLWVLLFNLRGYWHKHRKLALALLIFSAVAYFAQSSYFGVYRKFVTVFDFRFFVTDPVMTFELWWEHGLFLKPAAITLVACAILFAVMRMHPSPWRWLRWSQGALGVALFMLVTLNWYSAPHFQMVPVAYAGNLISALEFNLNREDYPAKPVLEYRDTVPESSPSMVFVIGESLNVGHMGVYGYERDTTPNLSRLSATQQVVAMRNAVSIGPRTLTSVPYMLTGLQGIDPHGRIYSVPTLFNYAKSAGYSTALISAQDFQWRNMDKLFVDQDMDHFEQGSHFSPDVSVSVGADDYQVLEKGIRPWLAQQGKSDKPFMLVLQMSGSHTPFSEQVPEPMKQFLPEENPNSINAYDNSVWYTDYVLNALLESVRAQAPDSWVFYSSDHGEHVTGKGGAFHGDFQDEVTHNSLLVFPPASAYDAVAAKVDAPLSQADIFATMLELMQVSAVTPIDGLSLLGSIPENRLRIVTAYMKTLHNDPRAALVLPDRRIYEIDFERGNVRFSGSDTVIPYSQWEPQYRNLFDQYLNVEQKEVN
ncbi:phosphoethanolamine transferase [Nitrincola sp. A-D6]|uniref:phosphoethanolamine transferase n=1 Tax=Nitrincola sp. A-D6 TaxID=1545442 RepID=UPI001363EBB6|nr:phosphoethanolamine transferase [Nitrincola sp. A-D6]